MPTDGFRVADTGRLAAFGVGRKRTFTPQGWYDVGGVGLALELSITRFQWVLRACLA